MNSIQLKSFGLLLLLWISAVHSWGTNCPNCVQHEDFLKVASWNANLVPGVSANNVARLNGAITYFTSPDVTSLGLDLLCLQEVYGSSQDTFIKGVQTSFPYAYAGESQNQQSQCLRTCNAQAITVLTGCSTSCTDQDGSNCLINSCNQQYLALDVNCQICIGNGQGSAEDILRNCAMDENAGATPPTCTMFGGSSGNIILSNQKFIDTKTLTFSTQGTATSAALLTKINWRGNNVNFICTNLLPDNTMDNSDDMSNKNNQQTQELIQWINTNVPQGEPLIVACDFNFGPAVGSNAGMFSQNYDLMVNAGFQSALIVNVPADQVPCTTCSNGNFVTNHVFIKTNTNPAACINDVNLVAHNQTVQTVNGEMVPLSSSSGVYATVCYAASQVAPPSPSPPPQIQAEVVVFPVQEIDDDSIRFGSVSSGSTALPVILFSAAVAISLVF